MEEKIVVKSEQYGIKKVCITIFFVTLLVGAIVFLFILSSWYSSWAHVWKALGSALSGVNKPGRLNLSEVVMGFILYPCLAGILFSSFAFLWISKTEIIVSDKRVYGKTMFGKSVDLPLDSVSAIGSKWPKGVAVATSSGKVAFLMIKNRDEIHKCISNLLIERQNKPTATTTIKQEVPKSEADELKKYKELLDSSIITQEEFDAKKKQLLGL